jgi:cytochrome c-type biogenesis protein CcsB
VSTTQLSQLSNVLVYGAVLIYAVSAVAFSLVFALKSPKSVALAPAMEVVGAGGPPTTESPDLEKGSLQRPSTAGERAGNIGITTAWLGTILLIVGVVLRGISAGRVPWGNMYEFSITASLAVMCTYLAISTKRDVRWLGVFVVVPVLLLLGLAVTVLYTDSGPLVPALHSSWLVIHVLAAITAFGAFTMGVAFGVAFLVVHHVNKRVAAGKTPGALGWMSVKLPEEERLDAMAYRVNAFGFPIWTFAVVAGAIWAQSAWGSYWSWDPKETWALITWIVYAMYLHARVTIGWKGTRATVISFIGYFALTFNFFAVNILFAGLHSYSGLK